MIFIRDIPPGPNAVEKDDIDKPTKFVVEIKDDVKEAVEIYPDEPKPVTVDLRFAMLLNPNAVLNEEKESDTKFVVEIREALRAEEDMYPIEPNPVTVDMRFPPPLPFVKSVAVKNVPEPREFPPYCAFAVVLLAFPT